MFFFCRYLIDQAIFANGSAVFVPEISIRKIIRGGVDILRVCRYLTTFIPVIIEYISLLGSSLVQRTLIDLDRLVFFYILESISRNLIEGYIQIFFKTYQFYLLYFILQFSRQEYSRQSSRAMKKINNVVNFSFFGQHN